MGIVAKLEIDPNLIDPNPWNYNSQTDRVQQTTRVSIGKFGFIDPVTVRVHPEIEGRYQIIDGEHRWRAALDLNLETIHANVIEVGDADGKKLTIAMNEIRGKGNKIELATLLADIKIELGDDLGFALPYTDDELSELVDLAGADWKNDLNGEHSSPSNDPDPHETWSTIRARIPDAVADVWGQARALIAEAGPLHEDEQIANGQVIEALAADFLAGHRPAAE